MNPRYKVGDIVRYIIRSGLSEDIRFLITDIHNDYYTIIYIGKFQYNVSRSINIRDIDDDGHVLDKQSIWENEIKEIINE